MASKDTNPYQDQDRGSSSGYTKYLAGMDAIVVEKVASASAFFTDKPGNTIVDLGMASGTSSYILGLLFPNTRIIGIDINPKMIEIAKSNYQLPNLEFITDDGETLNSLADEKINGFFSCSSIHHITSFNNYNPHKAFLSIKRQSELLSPGGILVIRDFVKPESEEIIIEFPDTQKGCADAALLVQFSQTARSLSPDTERGFPLTPLSDIRFRLNLVDAVEFIRRKNYLDDWEVELQEEYGYYSQNEFEEVFSVLGLRTIVSNPVYNPWIIKNRYENNFRLCSLSGDDLGYPPTNYIIAGEKTRQGGTALKEIRRLPVKENSFLEIKHFQNSQTSQTYEIAQRPFPVIDLLPYFYGNDGNIRILARHGYPRPIVTCADKNQLIDGKNYSGYLTESVTAMKSNLPDNELIKQTLLERASVNTENIVNVYPSLKFYTTPGGVDEIIDSYLVELKSGFTISRNTKPVHGGFKESGEIRDYDALQLLKSIQVGAVPDVRLELNLYNLLSKYGIDYGKWLSNTPKFNTTNKLPANTLKEVLEQNNKCVFKPVNKSPGFLKHERAKFYEFKRENSTAIFEFITPKELSVNTVLTIPVYRFKNTIYLGIELRHLPVPQIKEKNSLLLAAPAFRLPKSISDYKKLEQFIFNTPIEGGEVTQISRLGEKYFPCTGVSPEQVYPYAVTLKNPVDTLFWISIEDLYENRHKLRDGHLLICIYRLKHVLNNL